MKRFWHIFYFRPKILQRYVLSQFFVAFFICLFTAISLFLIFELFDRSRVFIKEGSTFTQTTSYLLLKIPLIIQLMSPIAVLVSTLVAIGRLSQLSEITAMRACGLSVFSLAKPLLASGLAISLAMFIMGETIVPYCSDQVEKIYNLDIRKKVERGKLSRENYWYREKNKYFNIGYYDSKTSQIISLSIFEFDSNNKLSRRLDAKDVTWKGDEMGWIMKDIVETAFTDNSFDITHFTELPLLIKEKPSDFYDLQRKSETMSYLELTRYISKLREEGVPITELLVQRAAKISFPLVNLIVVLVAFPFALTPARSGSLTVSFLAGVTIGFGYYVVHALSLSFGSADYLPLWAAAWSANILLGCLGGYLIADADYA